MYLTAGHFKFRPEDHTRALEIMATIVSIGRSEKGIHQYNFFTNPDTEYTHFLFEEWDSKEAHDAHFESQEMQEIVPEFFSLLAEDPDITYFDASLASKL
jgi:quinol monooxygenase YgiN